MVSRRLYVGVGIFAGLGVLLAVACLLFNWRFAYRMCPHLPLLSETRRGLLPVPCLRMVRESLAGCNNVMLGGCILCLLSLFLLGLPAEGILIPRDYFTFFCHVSSSLLPSPALETLGSLAGALCDSHGGLQPRVRGDVRQDLARPPTGRPRERRRSPGSGPPLSPIPPCALLYISPLAYPSLPPMPSPKAFSGLLRRLVAPSRQAELPIGGE